MAEEQTTATTKPQNSGKCRKYCALAGAFLILFPTSFGTVWGNISVYVFSYYYGLYGMTSALTALTSPWVLSSAVIGINAGLNVSGLLTKIAKVQTNLIIGTLLFNSAYFLCYLALKQGLMPLFFVAVFLIGMAVGIIDGYVFTSVNKWADKDNGRLISFACSGINFGPLVINPILSTYVNPDNLSTDKNLGPIAIFTQKEITERAPNMFLILGTFFFALQFIGHFMLMQTIPTFSIPRPSFLKSKKENNYGTIAPASPEKDVEKEEEEDTVEEHLASGSLSKGDVYRKKANHRLSVCSLEASTELIKSITSTKQDEDSLDVPPMKMLKTSVFYVFWLSYGSTTFTKLLLKNYYKTYGLSAVHDDHFLTSIGAVIGIAGGCITIVWGLLIDKFNVKTSLMGLYSGMVGFILMMYFSAIWDKWLYFVVTVGFGCFNNCVYPTFVTAVLKFYGGKYLSANLGLISTANIVISFAAPPLFVYFLDAYGWFSLFGWTASLAAVVLVVIVAVMPRRRPAYNFL